MKRFDIREPAEKKNVREAAADPELQKLRRMRPGEVEQYLDDRLPSLTPPERRLITALAKAALFGGMDRKT